MNSIYFYNEEMHPETLEHNLKLADFICTNPCTGLFENEIPIFDGNQHGRRTIAKLFYAGERVSVHFKVLEDMAEIIRILELWGFTGPITVNNDDGLIRKSYLNRFGEFDYESEELPPISDDPNFDDVFEPTILDRKSITRIYVSVFSDKFLIDSDGVLYSRGVNGDKNLCMNSETGVLSTVIGWDLDGNPCTITESIF